jgi:glycosyltransferase involved in cell wall biosynthesis
MMEATTSPRRILFVATWPLAEDTGYTVNARRTIEALEDRGHAVGVVQLVHRANLAAARSYADHPRHVGTVVLPPDRPVPGITGVWNRRVAARLAAFAAAFAPDVVHARGLRAGSWTGRLGQPVLLDVRGDVVAEAESSTRDWSSAKRSARVDAMRRIERVALASADGIAVVSDSMADWVAERVGPGRLGPIVVTPCSIDAESSAGLSPEHDGFTVAYAGGMQSYQPPVEVFGSLARVARATAADNVVVLTREREERYSRSREELCPRSAVFNLGADEVMSAVVRADIGVIPRIPDAANRVACPTKIAEYLAAGVPIAISPNLGRWHERITEWGVGLSLGASDEELADFARRVRADRAGFRSRCRVVAAREFSLTTVVLRLEDMYRILLGEEAG